MDQNLALVVLGMVAMVAISVGFNPTALKEIIKAITDRLP
jgi:hypothetical protein